MMDGNKSFDTKIKDFPFFSFLFKGLFIFHKMGVEKMKEHIDI